MRPIWSHSSTFGHFPHVIRLHYSVFCVVKPLPEQNTGIVVPHKCALMHFKQCIKYVNCNTHRFAFFPWHSAPGDLPLLTMHSLSQLAPLKPFAQLHMQVPLFRVPSFWHTRLQAETRAYTAYIHLWPMVGTPHPGMSLHDTVIQLK